MTTVYAIHAPEPKHLAKVINDMRKLGAPTIKVVDCGDYLFALEGSHRLAAAAKLGLAPNFDVIGQDDEIQIDGFDWFANGNTVWSETLYPAGEVVGELFSPNSAVAYWF